MLGLIFDDGAYLYGRYEAFKTLAVLMGSGQLPREAVTSLLVKATDYALAKSKDPMNDEEREDLVYFAVNIACEAADIGLAEFKDHAARIFSAGLWDDSIDDFDQIFTQLKHGEAASAPLDRSITDAWEYVRHWPWFESRPARPERRHFIPPPPMPALKAELVRRDAPKMRCNDACPCGRGKKFKKCCDA